MDNEYISECCGADSLGEIHDVCGEKVGMCADCKEHAMFVKENEE